MKNITAQYRDLLEGKISKANFMTNVRRLFPDYIGATNSLEDAVTILKGKRILSEGIHDMDITSASHTNIKGQMGDYNPKARAASLAKLSKFGPAKMSDSEIEKLAYQLGIEDNIVKDYEGGIANTEEMLQLIKAAEDEDMMESVQQVPGEEESEWDKVAKEWDPEFKSWPAEEEELESIPVFYLVDERGEVVDQVEAPDAIAARNHFENEYEGLMTSMTVVSDHPQAMYEAVDAELEAAKEEARKNSEEGYVQHVNKKGHSYSVEDWYDADSTVASYENGEQINEVKTTLNEATEKPEGSYKKVTGKEQYAIFNEIDRVNPYEFKKGITIEMGMQYLPTPNYFTTHFNPEALAKATKKVLKNLQKDPAYYTNNISLEFEKKSGLLQKPKELKVGADGEVKVKGFTDVKSNTETNLGKKEKGTKSPEGVKEMKPSKKSMGGIKIMKTNEKLPKGVELMKEDFRPGVNMGSAFNNFKQDIIGNKEDFELADENAFEDLVKKYDWYAEMSDDSRKWDAQQLVDRELKNLSKKIGVQRAVELFNQYAPADRKVTASFFSIREGKIAKLKEYLKAEVRKMLKEEDPALTQLGKAKEAKEKELADIMIKQAAILKKPGTQG